MAFKAHDLVCFRTRNNSFVFGKVCYLRGTSATIIGYNERATSVPIANLRYFTLDACPDEFKSQYHDVVAKLQSLKIEIDRIDDFSMKNLKDQLEQAFTNCGISIRKTALHKIAAIGLEDHRKGELLSNNRVRAEAA